MSKSAADRGRWEGRHRQSLESATLEPSELLLEFADMLREAPSGPALDIACGNGRNAFFLASLGYEVSAVEFNTMINAQMRLLRFELKSKQYLFNIYQKRAELEVVLGGPLATLTPAEEQAP